MRTTNADLGAHLAHVFGPLEAAEVSGAEVLPTTFDIVDRSTASGSHFDVYRDDELRGSTTRPGDVVGLLVGEVNLATVQASTATHVLLHASAMARGARCAVFPGPPGAGKTTLAAGLLVRGLEYVTDEVVAISRSTGEVEPYPKALSLKRGAWTVMRSLEPHVDSRWTGDQWHVDPRGVRADAIAGAAAPSFVIASTYDPDHRTALEPMRRSDALVYLMNCAFTDNEHGPAGFRALAATARAAACFRLTVGDLDEACALVLDLFDSTER